MTTLKKQKIVASSSSVKGAENPFFRLFHQFEPLCIVDTDSRFTELNTAMTELLDRSAVECIGLTVSEIFSAWDVHVVQHHITTTLTTRRQSILNDFLITEKGKKNWYQINFYPLILESQVECHCILSFKNVTELVLTKKILFEQYKKLEEQQINLENKNALLIETRKILDKKHQALMEEISIAQEVQRGILPEKLPHFRGIKFHVSYDPISQVGGDFYDVLDLGNDKVGIFIGDVSGHGLPAAFVGAMIKMALVNHAYNHTSPKVVLENINQNLIMNLHSGHYLTAFYGVLDLRTYQFLYCKASHPHPILVRKDEEKAIKLEAHGLFLGLLENPKYEEKSIQLKLGDRLYLFTDGYFEIKGPDGVQFLYDTVVELASQAKNLSLEEVQPFITRKIIQLAKDTTLDDDRTFLAMEIEEEAYLDRHPILEHFHVKYHPHIRFFSTEEEFDLIFQELTNFLNTHEISEDLRRKICVVCLELCNNSLEHAHHYDPNLKVQIAYSIENHLLILSVLDNGPGFDWHKIEDPRTEQNCQKERGRGIFIARTYSDELLFNTKGNMVTVKCLLSKVP